MDNRDKWMEKLVKNYKVPSEEPRQPNKKILTEIQKKIILGKDERNG
jgi:hypothetical protein